MPRLDSTFRLSRRRAGWRNRKRLDLRWVVGATITDALDAEVFSVERRGIDNIEAAREILFKDQVAGAASFGERCRGVSCFMEHFLNRCDRARRWSLPGPEVTVTQRSHSSQYDMEAAADSGAVV